MYKLKYKSILTIFYKKLADYIMKYKIKSISNSAVGIQWIFSQVNVLLKRFYLFA